MRHGFTHTLLMQDLPTSHSVSERHPTVLQAVLGLPSYPGLQLHTARWFWMWHSASNPQSHGFRHWRLMQASVAGHSESLSQPGSRCKIISLHWPLTSGTDNSGHSQIMVRTGTLFRTVHLAEGSQGFNSTQGFLHRPFIQASLLGQSGSVTHSG